MLCLAAYLGGGYPEIRLNFFVYVLGCRDQNGPRSYVGWTVDLERRLALHNGGAGAKATRGRAWELLYAERYKARHDAMSREWHLKRDRAFRRRLLHG